MKRGGDQPWMKLRRRRDPAEAQLPFARGVRAAVQRTHPPHSGQSRARQRARETDQVHGLREGLGQIRVAVAKREKPIQILERYPCTTLSLIHI